ncbi:hypothetical protein NDN08_006949 [Rhodosorus marinus]|uniref:Dihydroorotate dehydrogenase (quinone), mitochondrial n=1 Tax=Rhodosorus marinus TaxID=101924 RepID=A0AAV8UPM5_9RHOD|nr:hypothetical protein NDN08_006949 [Rhodosorus marinus]
MGTLIRLSVGLVTTGSVAAWAVLNDRIDVYRFGGGRIIQLLDPENAHKFAIFAAKRGFAPRQQHSYSEWEGLQTQVWGRHFANPIGLAAGFDKHAEAIDGCLAMGFGFVEVGSVTPEPQPGNPKPRVFRLIKDRAVINRYGFNSVGLEAFEKNLKARESQHEVQPGVVGVNLGKNKTTPEAEAGVDYSRGAIKLCEYADYIVVNVSSPNTPGLRNLQGKDPLRSLLGSVVSARDSALASRAHDARPPILVKIAPDLHEHNLRDVAEVVMELGIDGIIVSNTTVGRPDKLLSSSDVVKEAGGLSGPPLRELSTKILGDIYRLTEGKVPLVGCGGVSTGEDAYMKIRAGASLVELYTALIYDGPRAVSRIKGELAEALQRDGFKSVQEAVGADHTQ